ncbi:MAG: UvrD-helicase domain-containing protein [Clostridia bacterium]|nr:UvrD-helicase domain-containing protein [Clostridia bacterium]
MAINFTKEQQAVIDSRGKNILVSASAGSGKTTVMIQRIIDLVLDKDDKTPISKFLVVTFTKASASDMKKKLIDAFLKHQDDPFVLEQIDDVETSDISNLHSFCSRLISTYFYEIGVDPAFQVLDEANSRFLQTKAFERLFETKEKNADADYLKLFDIFQKNRKNSALKEIVSKFNDFLNANLDAYNWIEKSIDEIYTADLKRNPCAVLINRYVSNEVKELCEEIGEIATKCLKEGLEKVYDYFIEIQSKLLCINQRNSFEVNAKNLFEIEIPKAPIVKATVSLKPEIDEIKKSIKDQISNFKKNFISSDDEFLKQGLEASKECVLGLLKLVKEFNEIYGELKKEYNGLDFNDLEKYALKILENETILESIKSKYKYVFVDEYQDINSVQERIISLVSGKNNRFMVGDVKQSIYRFRYCDPEIFLDKYSKYEDKDENSQLHKLNCNFRSDKKILKFVDEVFAGVMTEKFGGIDYKKDSMFVAGESNLDNPNSVNLCFIDTTKQKQAVPEAKGVYSVMNHEQAIAEDDEVGAAEAKYVSNTIAELIKEKGTEFSFGQVAVLVGSRNAMVEKFIESLKAVGIPVSADEKYNLMDRPYIQEIINFVKFVCNQDNDILCFKVLKSRLFGFSDNELALIRQVDMSARFYECVQNFEVVQDLNLREKLRKFNEEISEYRKYARVLSLKCLCKKIIDDFDLRQINDASEECDRANNEINKLIDVLPDTDAFDFSFNYENFSLELESEGGSEDSVQLMTIHKSKGIEFKYVFVINTSNEFNFKSTFGNVIFNKDYGVGVDYFDTVNRTQIESIASSGIKLLEKRKLVEEKQRVLYVALTRAIERLYVVCSKPEEKVRASLKERKTCFADWFDVMIYNELFGRHNPIINFEKFDLADLAEQSKIETRAFDVKFCEEQEPEWFKYEFLDAVKIPLKSSISKILKDRKTGEEITYSGSSSAERGTAYHKCFQQVDFVSGEDFEKQAEKIYEGLTQEEKELVEKDRLAKILKEPFFETLKGAEKIYTEREFYAKVSSKIITGKETDDSFILQGIVDLIAIFDDGIVVVDYKTGKYNLQKFEDYSFQIQNYAEIVEKTFKRTIKNKFIYFIDEQKLLEI